MPKKDFGSYLEAASLPQWKDDYVNYSELKKLLKSFLSRRARYQRSIGNAPFVSESELLSFGVTRIVREHHGASQDIYFEYSAEEADDDEEVMVSAREAMRRIFFLEKTTFCDTLDRQIERAASLYQREIAAITNQIVSLGDSMQLSTMSQDTASFSQSTSQVSGSVQTPTLELVDKNKDETVEQQQETTTATTLLAPHDVGLGEEQGITAYALGQALLELMSFLVANITTLRQALVRYDTFVQSYGGLPLSYWYLQTRIDSASGFMQDMFHMESLNKLRLSYLQILPHICPEFIAVGSGFCPTRQYMDDFDAQFEQFSGFLHVSHQLPALSSDGLAMKRNRFFVEQRALFLAGSMWYNLSMEPSFAVMEGRNLKKEMKTVAKWIETRQHEQQEPLLHPDNVFPLILNLISCFLYMMNSYIVEPSSAYYASALGSSDALAGIVIGLTPWAALISAVIYSFWTNYSYRQPILLAGLLAVTGNLMYGNAYSSKSIALCLTGRFLCGLGAPRIINRRYLADATPYKARTAANAAFGVATALGAAMGPGAAIVLDMFDFEFYFPFSGMQTFNGMTGPGYFMAFLWTVYSLTIFFSFKEPKRTGLEELQQKERQRAKQAQALDISLSSAPILSTDFISEVGTFGSVDMSLIEKMKETARPAFGCLQHITLPVVLCMTLIFLKRVALESVVGATSIITKNRFGWSVKNVGTLHLVNGILVVPLSTLAGYLSQFFEDRYMTLRLLAISLLGMALLVDPTDFVPNDSENYNEDKPLSVGPVRYIIGSLIAFSGIEACESYVASLMSKVVPVALASGTFNSGLLATLVGTSGRATGDLFISAMGYISIRYLLNLLMVPVCFMLIFSMWIVKRHYEILLA